MMRAALLLVIVAPFVGCRAAGNAAIAREDAGPCACVCNEGAATSILSQAVPLDLPRAAQSGDVQIVFSVVLAADGSTQVDAAPVADDEAILPLAREARAKYGDLRAVIKADSKVFHGRVIHVLDLLKQAGIAKIAFGVTPLAPPVVSPKR
jgi:biopolymer transport protein ExbD